MVGDFSGSFQRSIALGLATMVVTVLASFAAGLALSQAAFRRLDRESSISPSPA